MRHEEIKHKTNEGLADMADMAERDHEVQMARSDLYKLAKYAIKLHEMLKGVSEAKGLEGWQQAKITKAADYISSVYHNLDYEMKFAEQQVEEAKKSSYKDGLGAMLESKKKLSKVKEELPARPFKPGPPDKALGMTPPDKALGMTPPDADFGTTAKSVDDYFKNTSGFTAELFKAFYRAIGRLKPDANPEDIKKAAAAAATSMQGSDPIPKLRDNFRKKTESKDELCKECGKPSYKTLDEEKQKGVDGKVCWKGYKRMGTKKKGGKTVDNCVKM
jgi:hypothetical protein